MVNTTENFVKQIENFLLLLTQKERIVVERRFNLDEKEKSTLEEIGQKFSVTRERIRQIEKNALNKLRRNLENTSLKNLSNIANDILIENGGLIREDKILSKLMETGTDLKIESLQLILSIDKRYSRVSNTVSFSPFIRLNNIEENSIYELNKKVVQILKKKRDVMKLDELNKQISNELGLNYDKVLLSSVISINKFVKFIDSDSVGLSEWRHINPKTLRDKIFYVLRKSNKPMHFVDIANTIISEEFDRKKVNLQAVHNELIRHGDFVLIGRGIYGLKEWGYVPGTVADVICSILSGKESLSQEEIINEVLKQRQVKPITIILSLKNKKQFIRVGRKQYAFKNS